MYFICYFLFVTLYNYILCLFRETLKLFHISRFLFHRLFHGSFTTSCGRNVSRETLYSCDSGLSFKMFHVKHLWCLTIMPQYLGISRLKRIFIWFSCFSRILVWATIFFSNKENASKEIRIWKSVVFLSINLSI